MPSQEENLVNSWPVMVSIITPCYNQERFIKAAIESAQAQSFTDWEMWVVDDASTDKSLEAIKSQAANDKRINILKNKGNLGPAHTRNRAIEAARGRFIAFLDGDDLWHPEKLTRQIAFMLENDYPFTFTWYDVVNEQGQKIAEVCEDVWSKNYGQLARSPTIAGGFTAIYDRQKVGTQLMPDILKRQDLGLWLKLIRLSSQPVYCLREKLGSYRMRTGSVSSNKRVGAAYTWRLFREVEGLSLPRASFYFAAYALNGLSKRFLSGLRRG